MEELDALRGFALLGILIVNIFVFHAPYCHYSEFYGDLEGIQATTLEWMINLVADKFLFIFAFLFGYGLVLQQRSRGSDFYRYCIKRLIVLLAFGVLHILVFWFGDILASYAVLGLLTLPLIALSDRKILLIGIVLLAFRPLYALAAVIFDWSLAPAEPPAGLEEFITVFQNGSYFEIFKLRMAEYAAFFPESLVWYLPKAWGLFLVGIFAARRKMFDHVAVKQLRYFLISISLIASSSVWYSLRQNVFASVDLDGQPLWRPFFISLNVLFETSLGMGYIFLMTVVFQRSEWLTRFFSPTGRLALTNYLLQSTICVGVFYGFGLGLYGSLKPTDLIIIAMAIFLLNIAFSLVYLHFHSVGPMEWLWRKLIGPSH